MAKQLVNPMERHVEKGVLGLAGLVLVGVIARYLVSTPNVTVVGSERVTPGTVDAKVAQKAVEVTARLRGGQYTPTIPEPLFPEFTAKIKPLEVSAQPSVVALGPEVPLVDIGEKGRDSQSPLVPVLRPAKPAVTWGRGTYNLPTPAGGNQFVPSDWVTVSAVMNFKAQTELQQRTYGAKRDELLPGPPEIQRRARRSNGTWSDEDWQSITPWPANKPPRDPKINLTEEGGKTIVDKDGLRDVDRFHGELNNPKMLLDLLRPMPPQMVPPTRWVLPIITSYRDVLMQDDELRFPSEAPAQEPDDRYGLGDAGPKKIVAKILTPVEQVAKRLEEGQGFLEAARKNRTTNDATRASNAAVDVLSDRNASAGDKTKAEKLKAEADQLDKDIKREQVMGDAQKKPVGGQALPTGAKRQKLSAHQVWVHDAEVESLKSGATYQYRIRFRVYNQLLGAPAKFNNAKDAAVVFAVGEWSEPSDPVSIEPATHFFVTGEDEKTKEVSVEFFQWYVGVWLKPERRIKMGIGQPIRDKQRVPAPDITDPNQVDRPEIEFAAAAVPVDVDFDRIVRERKAGTTPKGVKFAAPAPSTVVVLMDSEGRLQERIIAVEKNHPEKKEITGKLWQPPKTKQP